MNKSQKIVKNIWICSLMMWIGLIPFIFIIIKFSSMLPNINDWTIAKDPRADMFVPIVFMLVIGIMFNLILAAANLINGILLLKQENIDKASFATAITSMIPGMSLLQVITSATALKLNKGGK